jgi:hypothetical protein
MFGVGGHAVNGWTTNWIQNNVFLLAAVLCLLRVVSVKTDRLAWGAVAVGTFAWFPAETLYHVVISHLNPVPFPSITDAFWLASYPCFYVGLVLLARRRLRDASSGLWLDGLTGALAAATLGAAVILQVVVKNLAGSLSVVATNLAYPLADVVLIGFVVGACALLGWRPGRAWAVLGLGFVALVIADSIYVFQSAAGTYASGAAVDAIWTAAMLLVALAAWQPAGRTRDRILEGRTALVLPSLFIAVGIAVLTYDHFARVNLVAIGLAVATLVAAGVRTALSFRDLRNLAETRRQALTDDLTGLPNRRAFSKNLERVFAASNNG